MSLQCINFHFPGFIYPKHRLFFLLERSYTFSGKVITEIILAFNNSSFTWDDSTPTSAVVLCKSKITLMSLSAVMLKGRCHIFLTSQGRFLRVYKKDKIVIFRY